MKIVQGWAQAGTSWLLLDDNFYFLLYILYFLQNDLSKITFWEGQAARMAHGWWAHQHSSFPKWAAFESACLNKLHLFIQIIINEGFFFKIIDLMWLPFSTTLYNSSYQPLKPHLKRFGAKEEIKTIFERKFLHTIYMSKYPNIGWSVKKVDSTCKINVLPSSLHQ